jgi:hypothetical protein
MNTRYQTFMPNDEPKYVRCYDNGGESADRYTVVFTGRYRKMTGDEFLYRGMSANPFHPQGVGQFGSSPRQIDVNNWGFAPSVGRKNHLGKRIPFAELPEDCRKLVISDYKDIWSLNTKSKAA